MAKIERMRAHAADDLRPGERVIAAASTQPRGMWRYIAPVTGIGAGLGYFIATSSADSVLSAAVGGGIGGGAGAAIGFMAAWLKYRNGPVLGGLFTTLARTSDRLLVFRRSGITSRLQGLLASFPLSEITIEVDTATRIAPRPITITLADGTVHELESARIERAEHLMPDGG